MNNDEFVYKALDPDATEVQQLEDLAREIGVPFEYLKIGYITKGRVAQFDLPGFTSVAAYRAGLIEDLSTALTLKVERIRLENESQTVLINNYEYNAERLLDLYGKVSTWVKANGGTLPQEKKGCYIATAVYGAYDCPSVWVLRRFRDQTLQATAIGRGLVRIYYAISPGLVRRFGGATWFSYLFRAPLNRFVALLKQRGFSDQAYTD